MQSSEGLHIQGYVHGSSKQKWINKRTEEKKQARKGKKRRRRRTKDRNSLSLSNQCIMLGRDVESRDLRFMCIILYILQQVHTSKLHSPPHARACPSVYHSCQCFHMISLHSLQCEIGHWGIFFLNKFECQEYHTLMQCTTFNYN